MGFNFSFFGESEHRVFNYKPRYYDEEAEERRQLFGKVDGSAKGRNNTEQDDCKGEGKGYHPGSYIQGSFRDGNYQKTKSTTRIQRIIGFVGLVLFFIVLYYIARFYGLILK